MFAGRSFNDLSQYPVFPWVLTNFSSPKLDLSNSSVFRNLSLPIGALNETRLSKLKILKQELSLSEPSSLYRFHYMSAPYVISYLIRIEPFTSLHISLQKGAFDDPNRLFKSFPLTWKSVSTYDADFRELIPEFFSLPESCLNFDHFDLGIDSNEKPVDDVILPDWALSASQFIYLHRAALESDYVSAHLNSWIDLMFGYKQRGQASEDACNDFAKYSYFESLDLPNADVDNIQTMAYNFGITPDQLFKEPHKIRKLSSLYPISSLSTLFQFNLTKLSISGLNLINIFSWNNFFSIFYSNGQISLYKFQQSEISLVSTSKIRMLMLNLSLMHPHHFSVDNFSNVKCKSLLLDYLPTKSNYKSFCFYSENENCIVLTAPYMDYFKVVSLEKKKSVFKSKSLGSPITSISHESVSSIVVGTTDGSLVLFEKFSDPIYIIGHQFPIETVAIMKNLDSIVTCDRSGFVSIASVQTAIITNSFYVEHFPFEIHITPHGFILLLFQEEEPSIALYDIGGRKICSEIVPSSITSSCLCIMDDYGEFLYLSLKSKFCILYRVYDLQLICQLQVDSGVTCSVFQKENMSVISSLQNGDIVSLKLFH